MKKISTGIAVLITLLLSVAGLFAQTRNATGTPKFGSFGGGPDVINLGNLNSHIVIPVFARNGRGISFYYNFTYDTSVWTPVSVPGVGLTWTPVGGWGWQVQTDAVTGYIAPYTHIQGMCSVGTHHYTWDQWTFPGFVDPMGTYHHVPGLVLVDGAEDCKTQVPTLTKTASDGSGYQVTVTVGTSTLTSGASGTVGSRSGVSMNVPVGNSGAAIVTDTNGNEINTTDGKIFYDTQSATTPVLKISGTSPSPVSYTYVAPSGANAAYMVNYTSYPVQTNFNCTGVLEYPSTSVPLVSSITLPDLSSYTFTYETSTSGHISGRLKSVTLPTGGTITYTYKTESGHTIECADGTTAGLQRQTPDGTWNYDRSYNSSTRLGTTTILDPQSNETDINFSADADGYYYETYRATYQGSSTGGSQLSSVTTCYNGTALGSCPTATVAAPIGEVNAYRNFNGGSNARVDTTFNGLGLTTETDEYDFGLSSPTRKTVITYNTLLGNIQDRPTSVLVEDNSNTQMAKTTYGYDQTGTQPTTGTPQHVNVGTVNGNLTTVTKYTSSAATLVSTFSYYDTGLVYKATDPNGAVTTNTYTACGNSFLTSSSLPLSLSTSATWNCSGGVMHTSVDANGKTTTYNYTDAYYWRPSSVVYPDGGETDYAYNTTSAPWSTTTSSKRDSTDSVSTTTLLDGLGRAYDTQLTSDPAGTDHTVTTFNSLGQVDSVTNPYRTTSDPTYGSTSYVYDALGRVTTVTHPDSSTVLISYNKGATEVQDEGNGTARVTKVYQSDGLGRRKSVCEVTATALIDGTDKNIVACGQDIAANGFLTTTTYNTLNSVTVAQGTGQSRSYVYDQLSRLTSETNAESGTTTYTYDYSGQQGDLRTRTRPAANQTSSVTTTTTYSYDALHRLTGATYQNSDSSQTYTSPFTLNYDQATADGMTLTNTKGRMSSTSMVTGSTTAAQVFSYDTMGRPLDNSQCVAAACSSSSAFNAMPYTYDLLGNIASSPLTGGTIISYGYDNASNLTGITSNWVDSSHPSSLLSATTYNALGELTAVSSGTVSGSSGFGQAWNYDTLGRPIYYSTHVNGHATIQIQSGITYAGNSDVLGFADGILGYNWSYGYDDFNRLTSTTQSGAPVGTNQSYTYDYDRYGNRWHSTQTGGISGPSSTSYQFDTHNRLTPTNCMSSTAFCYDAAGNLTNDSIHAYVYDAEGRVVSVDSTVATYTYDALGRRVLTATGGHNWHSGYDLSSRLVWQFEDSTLYRSEVYGGAARVATYKAGLTFFPTRDLVGTVRNNVTQDYGYVESCVSLPFGDGQSCFGTAPGLPGPAFFTGQDRDTESNLDHFLFRAYTSIQGRWTSPDPAGLAAVDMTNPQSWNRYAYVGNNPLSYVDPLGLYWVVWCAEENCGIDWWDNSGYGGDNTSGPGQPPGGGYCADHPEAKQCLDDPGTRNPNRGTIQSQDKIHCAAAVANDLSAANQPSLPGPSNPNAIDKAVSYLANAVFGNTISGIVDFIDTARTATNAAPVYVSLATNGVRLGVPGGGVLSQGVVGVTQDTVLRGAFSNLGIYASKTAASVVGFAKFGYDAATFGYGLFKCSVP